MNRKEEKNYWKEVEFNNVDDDEKRTPKRWRVEKKISFE